MQYDLKLKMTGAEHYKKANDSTDFPVLLKITLNLNDRFKYIDFFKNFLKSRRKLNEYFR